MQFPRCEAKLAAVRGSKCKHTHGNRTQDSQPAPSTCTCPGYCSGLRPDEHVYSVLFVKYCVYSGHYITGYKTGLLVWYKPVCEVVWGTGHCSRNSKTTSGRNARFASRRFSWPFRPFSITKRREPITKWRGVTSHQNTKYFSLRAAFFFGIFNAAWARVWMSILVCLLSSRIYVQSLLVGLHPAEFLLCAPLLSPVSEVGLSCLVVILLRAFPMEWGHELC